MLKRRKIELQIAQLCLHLINSVLKIIRKCLRIIIYY